MITFFIAYFAFNLGCLACCPPWHMRESQLMGRESPRWFFVLAATFVILFLSFPLWVGDLMACAWVWAGDTGIPTMKRWYRSSTK